jgi:hypothetical protein
MSRNLGAGPNSSGEDFVEGSGLKFTQHDHVSLKQFSYPTPVAGTQRILIRVNLWNRARIAIQGKPKPMSLIRGSLLTFGAITLIMFAIGARYYCKGFSRNAIRRARVAGRQPLEEAERRRLVEHLAALRPFAMAHGCNSKIAFLVDMGLPSGKYRFFVANLEKDTLLLAGMVALGSGNHTFATDASFSNIDGSGCTSLGRYRIGHPYSGRFGRAYKLYGLDSTNSQAYRRNIVLHSFSYVPEAETHPLPICNSLGCPMVSPGFLQQLEPLIDHSPHPILLWIFH